MIVSPYPDQTEAERAYADLADEMNDPGTPPWDEADWQAETVALGKRWAEEQGLTWPPREGDYDRYYERRVAR